MHDSVQESVMAHSCNTFKLVVIHSYSTYTLYATNVFIPLYQKRYTVPPSTIPIWLDNLECTGTETRLVSCNHPGVNVENCAHSSDIGLVCHGNPTSSPTTGECCHSNVTLFGSSMFKDSFNKQLIN